MNNQRLVERRDTDEPSGRTAQDIDRFEDEGGPGPEDTRSQRRGDAPEIARPELPLSAACPTCDGTERISEHNRPSGRALPPTRAE
jgi:hypothetical protein